MQEIRIRLVKCGPLINALAMVDPIADAERKPWRRIKDGIVADNMEGSSFLRVPCKLPEEYNLYVTMT